VPEGEHEHKQKLKIS